MPLSPIDLGLTTLRSLTGNWVRSGLTALGIFMGVAAVNATLNIETISQQVIADRLEQRENPSIYPNVWSRNRPRPEFTDDLITELETSVPNILATSRLSVIWGSQVQYMGRSPEEIEISAVGINHQRTTGRQILAGRFFDQADFDNYRPVAIVDEVLQQQLFEGNDPLGEGLFVGNTRFTVVGVMETKSFWEGEEPIGTVWLTETYGGVMRGQRSSFDQIQIALQDLENYEQTQADIEAQLQRLFPGYEIFVYGNVDDLYEEEQRQKASIRVLQAVGILSLVIGGVGIANITIAAIMERTRETGLRRAIGATDMEIMAQFIAEAALLSLLGGTAAVVAVHFATQTATTTVFEAPYRFSPRAAALSMGAAFAIGVGSSLLPALRITRIDVVQALRGE